MLGHRGCRLGISYPEITEMQSRAIFAAAAAVKRRGVDVRPEIMIPLVSTVKEFEHQRAIVDEQARKTLGDLITEIPYLVGTMIELPRAALTADLIAAKADFFSFGTNDLTQTASASHVTTPAAFCRAMSRAASSPRTRSVCSTRRVSASSSRSP